MAEPIRIICSMATRQLLADLVAEFRKTSSQAVQVESVGGVDAAKRVQAGEAFDAVALASDAIERLTEAGHLVPRSRVDLVRSGVAIAVRAGAVRPDIGSGDAVRRAVRAAKTLGSSAGASPSRSRPASCRLHRAYRWASWWPRAGSNWAFSSSAS